MSDDCIQIAGHAREVERWERMKRIAEAYGGTATLTVKGNTQAIRVYGKVLCALLSELVTGRTAKDKGIAPPVWKYGNDFLAAMIDGYLSGDGAPDDSNQRWRLGFTRNYNLERDLRTACARLGYCLTLKPCIATFQGGKRPAFKGELRKVRSGHHNERDRGEIVEIRNARCREVYDLGVEDNPHLFALASGVLTHNSKPNPMPESVTDRPSKAHEQIFLLSKSREYFYDAEAVKEAQSPGTFERFGTNGHRTGNGIKQTDSPNGLIRDKATYAAAILPSWRNCRSVWTVPINGFKEAHFATFPPALPETCLKAGTSLKGCCSVCGAPWERVTESERVPTRPGDGSKVHGANRRIEKSRDPAHESEYNGKASAVVGNRDPQRHVTATKTTGWQPTCECGESVRPCLTLDPFSGAGTTGLVASKGLGLRYIGLELNPEYAEMSRRRIERGFVEPTPKVAAAVGQVPLF